MTDGKLGCEPGPPGAPGPPPGGGASDRYLLERFTTCQDGVAFETLVRRHGPMVLGVCQRVLGDAHDAEDAFQATFLVLVRKGGTLAEPDSLANWLYGVAYRTARKAKAKLARRRQHERQVGAMPAAGVVVEEAWRNLRGVLDEELRRLPEKYRAPLVLCYLEGKTNEQAARELGWPPGTMSARLARGRELLRERLAGPERPLPAGVFALALEQHAGAVALPGRLVENTVSAALGGGGAQGLAIGLASLSAGAALKTWAATGCGRVAGGIVALALAGLGAGAVACAALADRAGARGLPDGPPPPALTGPAAPCHSGPEAAACHP